MGLIARYFGPAVGWPVILRRTAREMLDDRRVGLAAQLPFYFCLSLFPALLFLVALIGQLPLHSITPEARRPRRVP